MALEQPSFQELRRNYDVWLSLLEAIEGDQIDIGLESDWRMQRLHDELHLYGQAIASVIVARVRDQIQFRNIAAETRKTFDPSYQWFEPFFDFKTFISQKEFQLDVVEKLRLSMEAATEDASFCRDAMHSREMPRDEKH